ncbi:MAG: glucoamylase family protein [Bacteroidales bacterium]
MKIYSLLILSFIFFGCSNNDSDGFDIGDILVDSITVNNIKSTSNTIYNIDYNNIKINIYFNKKTDSTHFNKDFFYFSGNINTAYNYSFSSDSKVVSLSPKTTLKSLYSYRFFIDAGPNLGGTITNGYSAKFLTMLDSTDKFPQISDDELLTLIQHQTFKYFWDFGHPASGMSRERNSSDDIVTIGGSGFGLMTIPIGIERGFISRSEGIARITSIVNFLKNADRFHGAWGHWHNGNTGAIIPFSTNDNGGDLVETSYMAQALITVRQYLNTNIAEETAIINDINQLLAEIEWNWYTKDGNDVLYWHWSPTYDWVMNMQISGYNEALITYFMAATSTNYPINASVYHNGWARNGGIVNGKAFYGFTLPVGYDYGGPLFFAHYSFLGLNPQSLSDNYANYWQQNVNHSLINRQYCINNPKKYPLYSEDCWGLTASDDNTGYGVHEPTRDIGVISPTAALSSMPYTPEESMKVARFLYYKLGDKTWGNYGFYDAFNASAGWWGSSYLAIDQGPIIIMIENYRTGLCWNLFMSAPEVQQAMTKLSFVNN